MMIIVTFPYLYAIYGFLIAFICLSILLAQYYQSEQLFHYLCAFSAILFIYLPIFLKYHSPWTEVNETLVSIFSAVTGFLFALKLLELGFTYPWSTQKQITVRQILIDFSTFPKYKYDPDPTKPSNHSPRWSHYLNFLLVGTDDEWIPPRQQNLLFIVRGLSQMICLHVLLHITPYSILRLHGDRAKFFSVENLLIYTLYSFVLYFALGMVINLVFGLMGVLWNVRLRSIYPGYPFLATSLHDFWSRRWNYYVKAILHRLAFVALPKLIPCHEKSFLRLLIAGLFAFFVSGLLHEFMYTVSMNRWSGGKNLSFFLIHALLVGAELAFQGLLRRKQLLPPLLGWIYTILALYATAHLFYDPWIEVDCFGTLKTYFG